MIVSENLKKKYKEAVEGCDLSVYADMVDHYAADKDIAEKIKEHARREAEKYDKVLRCPACGSVMVEEKRDNELFCHSCRHSFGLLPVVADDMMDRLERKIPEIPDKNVMRHSGICDELNELYARKNHDYGDSFHKTWLEEGAAAARLRIGDKFNRYKELSRGSDRLVGDETIEDTLIDMANYSIMALMEHRREAEENGCG
jgi:hypothetical protein